MEELKVFGVGRMADNDKAILVSFNRCPTDDELRDVHIYLRGLGGPTEPAASVERLIRDLAPRGLSRPSEELLDDLMNLMNLTRGHGSKETNYEILARWREGRKA